MKRFKLLYIALIALLAACNPPAPTSITDQYPPIYPDYINRTIPATIAPLNFGVKDAKHLQLKIYHGSNCVLDLHSKDQTDIPIKQWHQILQNAIGDSLFMHLSVWSDTNPNGLQYQPFVLHIASHPIDPYIAYRLIPPGYKLWNQMGLYQRELSSFEERTLMSNQWNDKGCVNCHSFHNYSPHNFLFHARGKKGCTVLVQNDTPQRLQLDTIPPKWKGTYPYWHPSGKYIVFSNNDTHQSFYGSSKDKVEVYDLSSDIMIYDLQNKQVLTDHRFTTTDEWETFPTFSPDGNYLYFCQASSAVMPTGVDSLHYSLLRVPFNTQTGALGFPVDTIFKAGHTTGSASFPRISPDGKYLIYTHSDCGTFPIWHKEADLRIIDLQTLQERTLTELNSSDVESYHSWSSNSRWLIFSSRRLDGRYTRLFLSYLQDDGTFTTPFLLPQSQADFDEYRLFSYNIPEFVSDWTTLSPSELKNLFN